MNEENNEQGKSWFQRIFAPSLKAEPEISMYLIEKGTGHRRDIVPINPCKDWKLPAGEWNLRIFCDQTRLSERLDMVWMELLAFVRPDKLLVSIDWVDKKAEAFLGSIYPAPVLAERNMILPCSAETLDRIDAATRRLHAFDLWFIGAFSSALLPQVEKAANEIDGFCQQSQHVPTCVRSVWEMMDFHFEINTVQSQVDIIVNNSELFPTFIDYVRNLEL